MGSWLDVIECMGSKGTQRSCGVGRVDRLQLAGWVWTFIMNWSANKNPAVWNGAAHCRSGDGFEGTQRSGLANSR